VEVGLIESFGVTKVAWVASAASLVTIALFYAAVCCASATDPVYVPATKAISSASQLNSLPRNFSAK
jgi:hypothetical protein